MSQAVNSEGERLPAKQVFLAWEKLRIVYNLALIVATLAILGRMVGQPELWIPLSVLVVGANACFFAGPIAEMYLTWLGLPGSPIRYGLFLAGTTFAVLLAWWNLVLMLALPAMG